MQINSLNNLGFKAVNVYGAGKGEQRIKDDLEGNRSVKNFEKSNLDVAIFMDEPCDPKDLVPPSAKIRLQKENGELVKNIENHCGPVLPGNLNEGVQSLENTVNYLRSLPQ